MALNAKQTPHEQLQQLETIFGPEYFQHGRLVITAARDLQGVMKVARRLQSKANENFGAMVEVIMEHVKHELWVKLHETTTTMGLQKGQELPECQVTQIPDGIRVHPYQRDHLPTLEVLLLWEDGSGQPRGHCLYTMAHPELPKGDEADDIFELIRPFFAKRWLQVQLKMAPPIRGEFDEEPSAAHSTYVGAGVEVMVLAMHPFGFASDGNAAHVTTCQPVEFKAMTAADGRSSLCFLPAQMNKVQIMETEAFYAAEVSLTLDKIRQVHEGHTEVTIELTPKALSHISVNVFEMPSSMPTSEDGIIDWAAEDRKGLPGAAVQVIPLQAGAAPVKLSHVGDGTFVTVDNQLPEGCMEIEVSCDGFRSETKAVMLLVGTNDFYMPLRRA